MEHLDSYWYYRHRHIPCLCRAMCYRFSRVRLCATPWTVAHQAPPSLGFSRQEHWSGLSFPSLMHESEKWKWSCSVGSDPQRPHRLQPSRLLHPWDFPGKSTGVGCHCLLQEHVRWLYLLGIKIAKRNINNLRYADGNHSKGIKWRRIKTPLDEGERGEWKCWLETQHPKKPMLMVSSPITSWKIKGEKVEAVTDFIFLGSKILVGGGWWN